MKVPGVKRPAIGVAPVAAANFRTARYSGEIINKAEMVEFLLQFMLHFQQRPGLHGYFETSADTFGSSFIQFTDLQKY